MPADCHNYEDALQYLIGRINYESAAGTDFAASDFKLERMRHLLAELGHPEERLPAVHVAGTKGKGSTCTMTARILSAAGYRAGLYTSPHLHRFEERFVVDGVLPTEQELVDLVQRIMPTVSRIDAEPGGMQPTYFELATALAWLHFLDQRADIAVLETGLGGRLDSTNVCRPVVTGLTSISFDHMHLLGNTIAQIAHEKAGILKPGVPAVSSASHPDAIEVFHHVARERGCPLWQLGNDIQIESPLAPDHASSHGWVVDIVTPARRWARIECPLRGRHQMENVALVLGIIDWLREAGWRIGDEAVVSGLANTRWPARIEVVAGSPTTVLDAAHNPASAKALRDALSEEFPNRKHVLVFASSADKDVESVLKLLLPGCREVIFTRFLDNPRAQNPERLQQIAASLGSVSSHCAPTPLAAWQMARSLAGESDLLVVTGSFFLVAELRQHILAESRERASSGP